MDEGNLKKSLSVGLQAEVDFEVSLGAGARPPSSVLLRGCASLILTKISLQHYTTTEYIFTLPRLAAPPKGRFAPFIVTYSWSYTFIENFVSLPSMIWKLGFWGGHFGSKLTTF